MFHARKLTASLRDQDLSSLNPFSIVSNQDQQFLNPYSTAKKSVKKRSKRYLQVLKSKMRIGKTWRRSTECYVINQSLPSRSDNVICAGYTISRENSRDKTLSTETTDRKRSDRVYKAHSCENNICKVHSWEAVNSSLMKPTDLLPLVTHLQHMCKGEFLVPIPQPESTNNLMACNRCLAEERETANEVTGCHWLNGRSTLSSLNEPGSNNHNGLMDDVNFINFNCQCEFPKICIENHREKCWPLIIKTNFEPARQKDIFFTAQNSPVESKSDSSWYTALESPRMLSIKTFTTECTPESLETECLIEKYIDSLAVKDEREESEIFAEINTNSRHYEVPKTSNDENSFMNDILIGIHARKNCSLPDVLVDSLSSRNQNGLSENVDEPKKAEKLHQTLPINISECQHVAELAIDLRSIEPPILSLSDIIYELEEKGQRICVGKGSFGEVFLARYKNSCYPNRLVVVKEFEEEYTSEREVYEEAQRLLYLKDTGYVPVCYGLVRLLRYASPVHGIVQDFVGTGLTLETLLWEKQKIPKNMWLTIGFQLCDGVASFHAKGILLNDLKSNNIILEQLSSVVSLKFIDFGLSTDLNGKRYKVTNSLEDYVYLAPEVRNGNITTKSSDVYSLGYLLDQIHTFGEADELEFVADLCMQERPNDRLAADFAAALLYEKCNHM
ncbi:hypothetical protein CHS0354_026993 [Potamilus streckersoni]|uniref:Protein kinase domain-containing protein n=1 Tax=Potamilus streckersoni TaxID=2493646 RepID=A0AAE0VUD7_9BIVA|nr:hypothetical protein CHS0354_026993 [Potamilus streckersoni]